MKIPEVVVCRDEPSVCRIGGYYAIVFQRDAAITSMIAEEMQTTSDLISQHVTKFATRRDDWEWKLPIDPASRIIEFRGHPTIYSKIRFQILKRLILADGKPVSCSEVVQAAWEGGTDKEVLLDSVYQFNQFFKKSCIPKFIRCEKEFLILEDRKKSKHSAAKRQKTPKAVK
jgi:hypothetical protein